MAYFINMMFASLMVVISMVSLMFVKRGYNYEIVLVFSALSIEPIINAVNLHLFEFLIKLKYLGKCEELTRIRPEEGYQDLHACLKSQITE